jgi:hypothetical protein
VVIGSEEIGEGTVPVPASHVALVEIDDDGLLVDEEAGRAYPVNATAALLWKLLDSVSPVGDLIDDISAVYGAPRSAVAESVHDLLRTFGELGLLRNVGRSFSSVPIDVIYADDPCLEPLPPGPPSEPPLDDRYLPVPPNA